MRKQRVDVDLRFQPKNSVISAKSEPWRIFSFEVRLNDNWMRKAEHTL